MKKILSILIIAFVIVGCSKDNKIPSKEFKEDNSALSSPINSTNLDEYMNRNDVQYIDLRSSRMVLEEGYVAGFSFLPFYNVIASFSGEGTLYKMAKVGENKAGSIGGFVALYEESDDIIKSLFEEDKYIFLISQAGSESAYLINLLIQLGYDGNLLYNVGGVSNSEGPTPYKDIRDNKYYVEGHSGFNPSVNYDFVNDLTPINYNN